MHSGIPVGLPQNRLLRTRASITWAVLSLVVACLSPIVSASYGATNNTMFDTNPQSAVNLIAGRRLINPSKLECLEVGAPILRPSPTDSLCSQTLMEHSFTNSYGKPFVAQYTPPSCKFARVVLNLTVRGAGRQFDRLAIAYLGDAEIWRTSTAEPTAPPGIIWTYMKDATAYLSLWKQPQTFIFDLGNLVNNVYTSPFNATLTATFFNSSENNELSPADMIIPISKRQSDEQASSEFRTPGDRAINTFALPRNAKRAIFSISACGQMAEEFWWSNAPDSTTSTFGNATTLLGHSPFREVQLLVDGQLAGVSWPFPVIFTGGVVPGFWRPVVGIDAFDLREDEIDITPWLPVISDGQEHSFEIRVMGLSDDGTGNAVLSTTGDYWVVTGKLFLWLDPIGYGVSGSAPFVSGTQPDFFITSSTGNSGNTTLSYQVLAQRRFAVSNSIQTINGVENVTWSQTLSYSNIADFVANGSNQTNSMLISGTEISSSGYSRKFAYPLFVFNAILEYTGSNGMFIDGRLDRSKNVQVLGNTVFPSPLNAFTRRGEYSGWTINNRQNGTAYYVTDGSTSGSAGVTEQDFVLKGVPSARSRTQQALMGTNLLYSRHVLAANNSIITDTELGAATAIGESAPVPVYPDQLKWSEFALLTQSNVAGGKVIRHLCQEGILAN